MCVHYKFENFNRYSSCGNFFQIGRGTVPTGKENCKGNELRKKQTGTHYYRIQNFEKVPLQGKTTVSVYQKLGVGGKEPRKGGQISPENGAIR